MSVSSHVARDVDFRPYRTFDWGPADALPTGDPRLDRDPFFQDHLEGAIEKQLAVLGYERSASTWPDLLIHYHASIDTRIDVAKTDSRFGFCYDEDCNVKTFEYEAGTLVLDIVDARTDKVIWRGWAQDALGDVLENQDRMADQIEKAVTRMLERFPRSAAEPAVRVPVSQE
jgi:hypothetical protein